MKKQTILLLIAGIALGAGITTSAMENDQKQVKPEQERTAKNFFEAIKEGNLQVVKNNIQNGYDVNQKYRGYFPLAYAAGNRGSNDKDIVKLLIDAGANLDAIGDDKSTALTVAAYFSRKEIVMLLIDASANVNIKGYLDSLALPFMARTKNGEGVVQRLINAGANVNAKDNNGKTVLMWAVWDGPKESVQCLINAGANVHAKDSNNKTVLMWAVRRNDARDIVKLLIESKVDVHEKDNTGKTALMYTPSTMGRHEAAQCLIEAGADVNARDNNGETVLIHAINQSLYEDIFKYLTESGADAFAKDNTGKTALVRMNVEKHHHAKEIGEVLVKAMIKQAKEYKDTIYCFLWCAKKEEYKNVFPKEIRGRIAQYLAEDIPQVKKEIDKMKDKEIKQHLLYKYFPKKIKSL